MPKVRISFCGSRIVLALALRPQIIEVFETKNGPNVRPHRSRVPPRQVFDAPGANRKTWEKSELRSTNVSAWRLRAAFFIGLVTKRGRSRTAIYWPRIMWLTRGGTRIDLETPDARAVDADRLHGVGPRRGDLHIAHRRSQVEINLW